MTTTVVDRLAGVSEGLGRKAPVRCATTANITLTGLQTIDGIVLVAGDRVLVKDQTDTTTNGIYDAKSGAWVRSKDFNGTRDVKKGTSVLVSAGTVAALKEYVVSSADPITIGTSALTFATQSTASEGGSIVAANPSASVGFTAVNGSSPDYMRADGAPAAGPTIARATTAAVFGTVTEATAATIPAEVTVVVIAGGGSAIDDGNAGTYQYSATVPGSSRKFQSANGRWFKLIFNNDLSTPGLQAGTGVAQDAIVTTALASRPFADVQYLHFGPGVYYFADNITITLSDDRAFSMKGIGIDATILRFAAGKGIIVNYATGFLASSAVTISDMSITTDDTNGGNTGIKLVCATGTNQGAGSATTLSNLSFHGYGDSDVEGTAYWETAIDVFGVNKVQFLNCWFYSVLNTATSLFDLGTGIYFHPQVGYSAVEFNIVQCAWVDVGFGIVWGDTVGNSIEGLTMSGCNLVGCNYGIYVPPGCCPSTQICIANSHFNCYSVGIYLREIVSSVLITNCLFITAINPLAGSCIIIKNTAARAETSCDLITNCHFYAQDAGKEAIVVTDIDGVNIIGNTFFGFTTLSVLTNGTTSNTLVAHNHYLGGSATFGNTSASGTVWRGLKCTAASTASIASP